MVDDNPGDRDIAHRCFKRSTLPNEWLDFPGGVEFLDHLDRVRRQLSPMPALVLLDINMPAMTGFDVLEKVREDEFFDELPKFCVLTSSADPRDRERATTLRALGVFTKPYEIRDYVAFFDAMNDPGACTE